MITDSRAKIRLLMSQTEPVEIGYFETLSCAKETVVRTNLVYMVDIAGGFYIFDVSGPGNVTQVGRYSLLHLPSSLFSLHERHPQYLVLVFCLTHKSRLSCTHISKREFLSV